MGARDFFIKADRHIEPLKDRRYIAQIDNATPPVTGGPSAADYSFHLPWDTSELVREYLTFRDSMRVSSLVAVLRDARTATGRSERTGRIRRGQERRAGNWLGALGYMVTVEHIGRCFRPRDAGPQQQTGFRGALSDFAPHLGEEERNALYALRCCFAHDYSLVNGPKSTPRSLWHRFTLHADERTPLVVLPPEQWQGELASPQPRTRVNLRKLGDLAEEVFRAVVKMAEQHELDITLPGGVNDLRVRYTLFVSPQSE